MKTHYAAKELAGLPGLPGTERAIQIMAGRENWSWQKRAGRGGGREYALSALPAATQNHLAKQALVATAPVPATTAAADLPAVRSTLQPATTTAQLKTWQRECMDARVAIMRLIERAASVVGVNKAINTIVKAAAEGNLEEYAAANIRKGVARSLSYGGIIKWWSTYQISGHNPLALAPKDVENYQEPAWAGALLACWRKPQKPSLTDVLADLQAALPPTLQMPSYGQARHYLQKLGAIEKEKGRKTGNELKAMKTFRRRDTSTMYPGDAYTADGHCFDGEVAHPYHGRPFRPEATPIIDVCSRKIVGWSCDLAESGLAVLDALRMACETAGVPAIFYTDNGSGYKNQLMTAPGTGILNRLGITPHYSRPRNPQAHGISERTHQTVLIKAAKQLCTYIGAPMDTDAKQLAYKITRKQIREDGFSALLVEWDDFVDRINSAIERYNNTPHRGLPAMRDPLTQKRIHMTPNQAWESGLERMHRELHEDEWLHPANESPDLYHPAVERTVVRGEIQFGTLTTGQPKRYYSADLEEWNGQRVQVAYSPSDASKVWVRDLEHGRLLAVALLGGNSSAYFAESVVELARIKRGKGRLKRLENHAEEVRLEMQGPNQVVVEHPAEVKEVCLRMVKQIEEAQVVEEQFCMPEDPQEALRCWQGLNDRRKAGEALPEDQERAWKSWQNHPVWKAWKTLQKMMEPQAEPALRAVK